MAWAMMFTPSVVPRVKMISSRARAPTNPRTASRAAS
jgi:hypothetical protein